MLRQINIILGLFTVFLIASCSSNTVEPVDEDPFIVGEITQVEEIENGVRVLVEEDPEVEEPSKPGGMKIRFTVDGESEILIRQADGSLRQSNVETLEIGQTVEGWAKGVVVDTHPLLGTARRIVIVNE